MYRVSVFVLACAASALAGDPVLDAADAALIAFRERNDTLAALAAKDNPDPWLVADELCARGELDAAEAFAMAAPRTDVERLPEYVGAQRAKPTEPRLREALGLVNAALAAKEWERVTALAGLATSGGDVTTARLRYAQGLAHQAASRWGEASTAYLAAAKTAEGIGWLARRALALHRAGDCFDVAGHYRQALAAFEELLRLDEVRSDPAGIAAALGNAGLIHFNLGDYARALECQERALKVEEELGNPRGIARTLVNVGNIWVRRADYRRALENQERALKFLEEIGDKAWIAATLGNIGIIHEGLGDYTRALEYQERALELHEELGDQADIAWVTGNIGILHWRLGDCTRALECETRALAAKQKLGDRAGVARTLGSIGRIHLDLGDGTRSIEYQKQALKLMEELEDRAGMALALGDLGGIYEVLADYAGALGHQERALKLSEEIGNRAGTMAALGNMGNLHWRLGDYDRALDYQGRALKLAEELGDRARIAAALGNIGSIHHKRRDYARALEYQELSLKRKEECGDRLGIAQTIGNIGLVHWRLGDSVRALEYQERALKLKAEIGDRAGFAGTLGNIGEIHESLANYPQALAYRERALAAAREVGIPLAVASCLQGIASTHLAAGRPGEAVPLAREAMTMLPQLVSRLGDEEAAMARERWADLFDVGAAAAAALGDTTEAAVFLESGRAGALLESLGGREVLRSRAVPETLQALEREARARETVAQRALQRALKGGDRADVQARRADLDKVQTGLEDAIARIQRDAKAAGALAYGRVDSLEEIRARVREGESLVLYGPGAALVVTREGARLVKLEDCEPACAGEDWAKLRTLAVDPLGLDPKITRILVSPVGALSQVPFCLLAPDREVVYVPSGTTYGLLLDEAGKRGDGVLALGDPDYETSVDAVAATVLRGSAALEPLPATREEAKAVGDTVLLGGHATEAGLLFAIRARPRWRAIHLACHGLVNHKRAQLSSLALSGGDFFTVLEVFGTRVPADLVVLSACETAKGAIYRAEGVMGFVRAFMFAGAPRVIVSLWKVDDEATKALMIRFYELWKAGKPAATALKEAQRFVASHEKWKDPRYWAAWQLWGLAD